HLLTISHPFLSKYHRPYLTPRPLGSFVSVLVCILDTLIFDKRFPRYPAWRLPLVHPGPRKPYAAQYQPVCYWMARNQDVSSSASFTQTLPQTEARPSCPFESNYNRNLM